MNTNQPFVITISRELGSGGRTIGRQLAAQLNVRYSDKNLIHDLMSKFKLTASEIEQIKAKKKNWLADLLEVVAPVPNSGAYIGFEAGKSILPSSLKEQDIYEAECKILHEIAAEGSCVIAGRSGFFVLKDHPNKVDIFITAGRESRIARVMKKQSLSREQAEAVIDDIDRGRENYVKRFAGVSRYDARNYDLVMNVEDMTEEEAVACILKYLKFQK